jgi:hypothetical protein
MACIASLPKPAGRGAIQGLCRALWDPLRHLLPHLAPHGAAGAAEMRVLPWLLSLTARSDVQARSGPILALRSCFALCCAPSGLWVCTECVRVTVTAIRSGILLPRRRHFRFAPFSPQRMRAHTAPASGHI